MCCSVVPFVDKRVKQTSASRLFNRGRPPDVTGSRDGADSISLSGKTILIYQTVVLKTLLGKHASSPLFSPKSLVSRLEEVRWRSVRSSLVKLLMSARLEKYYLKF